MPVVPTGKDACATRLSRWSIGKDGRGANVGSVEVEPVIAFLQ